jgi:hypothetical protein
MTHDDDVHVRSHTRPSLASSGDQDEATCTYMYILNIIIL